MAKTYKCGTKTMNTITEGNERSMSFNFENKFSYALKIRYLVMREDNIRGELALVS